MHKTKKKSKIAKLPKPIKVKKEKADEDRLPQPMTYYLDDRLEMVKQIFNSLKPKTIVNLSPEFLKTQTLEEIEEACLNELLCISTKRLKSIITATKCPTDTESSDNDSDVERREEHISLEEISSDSEIEGSTSKKARKKRAPKVAGDTEVSKKNTSNEDNQGNGQISVLELLELQARARAIRSQLALEPVTKIEVDSDEENGKKKDDNKPSKGATSKANKGERKRVSSERESRDSSKLSRMNGSTENGNSKARIENEDEKTTSKKIKLKRNYRGTTNKEIEGDTQEKLASAANKEDKEKSNKVTLKEKNKEQGKTINTKDVILSAIKKEKSSRSPSPDVIPIVAEPETLLITDSSDEEKKTGKKSAASKATSEKTINKDGTQSERKNIAEESGEGEKDRETLSTQKTKKAQNLSESAIDNGAADSGSKENSTENTQSNIQLKIGDKNDAPVNNVKSKDNKLSNKDKLKSNDGTNSTNHSEDDQNDDVISLGGDLENEMNEQLENEVNNVMQSQCNKKSMQDSPEDNKSQDESQADDVISLESSEDERDNDNQSWHSRYMKSSKVSKVLAASRLGKRVRDKIKKSKHSKKETSYENSDAEKEKSTPAFSSKHEDGSVEQYKELLEMRQRKSS